MATRLSPGVYQVNGKTVNAKSAAEADKLGAANKKLSQGGGAGKGKAKTPPIIKNSKNLDTVSGQVDASRDVEQVEAEANIRYQNPDIINDFGESKTTLNPDGTVRVEQRLAPGQKDILDRGTDLTKGGLDLANQRLGSGKYGEEYTPETVDRVATSDQLAKRDQVEKAVYDRLTRFNAGDKSREMQDKQQELYNQGIQYSEDPNSRYQKEIGDLNRRYDQNASDAMNAAYQFGGQEQERQVGLNEQVIANQTAQGYQQRNQGINEINAFQGMGTGLQVPNFQPYQGPNYQLTNPLDAQNVIGGQKLAKQQLEAANRKLGGSGGGGSPVTPLPAPIPIA